MSILLSPATRDWRILENSLDVAGVRFDLSIDRWPAQTEHTIFNPSHSIAYRLFDNRVGAERGGYSLGRFAASPTYVPFGPIVLIPAETPLFTRHEKFAPVSLARLQFPVGRFPDVDAALATLDPRARRFLMNVDSPAIRHTLRRLSLEAAVANGHSAQIVRELVRIVSIDMRRYLLTLGARRDAAVPIDIAAIEDHMERLDVLRVSPKEMASMFDIGERQFSRLFRQMTGTTFQRYLEGQRIKRVCALLALEALPLKQVAFRAGYADHAALTKAFRRHFGQTPSAYRAALQP